MWLAMVPMDGLLPIYRPASRNRDFLQVHHVPTLAPIREIPKRKLLEHMLPMLQKDMDGWAKVGCPPPKRNGE